MPPQTHQEVYVCDSKSSILNNKVNHCVKVRWNACLISVFLLCLLSSGKLGKYEGCSFAPLSLYENLYELFYSV